MFYEIHKTVLGEGSYGKVFYAESQNCPFAIKQVKVKKLSADLRHQMEEELLILFRVDHPYVVKAV